MQFTYGGVEFTADFNMVFQKSYWHEVLLKGAGLDGGEMLAVCIYEGNRAHVKLNGGQPVFKSIQEVYKLINTNNDSVGELAIISEFMESQAYKSMIAEDPTAEKKTLTSTM